MFTNIYDYLINAESEQKALASMITTFCSTDSKILDVGCGFGRNIKALSALGYQNITGVEVNSQIAAFNNQQAIPCITPDEFDKQNYQYDLILMSHVIEHFAPADLVEFLDRYLYRLKMAVILLSQLLL